MTSIDLFGDCKQEGTDIRAEIACVSNLALLMSSESLGLTSTAVADDCFCSFKQFIFVSLMGHGTLGDVCCLATMTFFDDTMDEELGETLMTF